MRLCLLPRAVDRQSSFLSCSLSGTGLEENPAQHGRSLVLPAEPPEQFRRGLLTSLAEEKLEIL